MLKPLEEFYCDTCRGLIEAKKVGYFVFDQDEDQKRHSFRIVHSQKSCITDLPSSLSLERITSDDGLGILMSWIHLGELEGNDTSEYRSNKEFAEVFKRLHLPHYEQARIYFDRALSDGLLDGNSNAWHSPGTLQEIISRYEEE